MDKDEILRKAQSDDERNEMERRINAEGTNIAFKAGIAGCLILMAIQMMTEQCWENVVALIGIMACIPHFYCWKKLNKKQELLNGLIWLGFALFFVVLYFIRILYYNF